MTTSNADSSPPRDSRRIHKAGSRERRRPPYRAEHVGSLLRPLALTRAMALYENGRISAAELSNAQDAAVREAVRMQEDLGFKAVTDGEFRRTAGHMDFLLALGGISAAEEELRIRFQNECGEIDFSSPGVRVTGPLELKSTIFGRDFAFLKSVSKHVPKITIHRRA